MKESQEIKRIKGIKGCAVGSGAAIVLTKIRNVMKKLTWDAVLKVVIAVASAILGALSAHAMPL